MSEATESVSRLAVPSKPRGGRAAAPVLPCFDGAPGYWTTKLFSALIQGRVALVFPPHSRRSPRTAHTRAERLCSIGTYSPRSAGSCTSWMYGTDEQQQGFPSQQVRSTGRQTPCQGTARGHLQLAGDKLWVRTEFEHIRDPGRRAEKPGVGAVGCSCQYRGTGERSQYAARSERRFGTAIEFGDDLNLARCIARARRHRCRTNSTWLDSRSQRCTPSARFGIRHPIRH